MSTSEIILYVLSKDYEGRNKTVLAGRKQIKEDYRDLIGTGWDAGTAGFMAQKNWLENFLKK